MTFDLEKLSIGNGAGSIKRVDQVAQACKTPMTQITVGSITGEQLDGNIGETYYFHPQEMWSLNSLGLPNLGMEAYKTLLPDMIKVAHDAGKELWASISPFSAQECAEMADECLVLGVDGVEINGSCPNVWKDGKRKAIPALDPIAAEEMFDTLAPCIGNLDEVRFKLSPVQNGPLLKELADVFCRYQVMRLVCCNAQADQYGKRVDGKPALSFRANERDTEVKHTGGLGGMGVRGVNMWVAREMKLLMPTVEIIGIGGIFTGTDAAIYLEHGASGLQSTTGYLEFGGQLFVDILMFLSLSETERNPT